MRCFVAVEVSGVAIESLARVISEVNAMDLDASAANPGQLHCTLAFLGEKSGAEVKKIIELLQQVRQNKFIVRAAGLGFFPNQNFARVFWAGLQSSELVELQKKVVDALGVVQEKLFASHVTLARIRSNRNVQKLLEYAAEKKETVFGAFAVSKFVLKKSTLSPQGAIYEDVAEFALV